MTTQNYLIVEANVVTNVVVWDGNTQDWTPPADSIQLAQATTPAMVWTADYTTTPYSWKLASVIGAGSIGFTWDGTTLTTNNPKPTNPPVKPTAAADQPASTGTTTI
jgi:hypothetical protein